MALEVVSPSGVHKRARSALTRRVQLSPNRARALTSPSSNSEDADDLGADPRCRKWARCGPPPKQVRVLIAREEAKAREIGRAASRQKKFDSEDESGDEAAAAVGATLARMSKNAAAPRLLTCFHSARIPALAIRDYLAHIRRVFGCTAECFVLCLAYIHRLTGKNPVLAVNDWSSHRLLLTGLTVAAKFHDDVFYSNAFYAKAGGVSTAELNALEGQFLDMIDWKLRVSPEEFELRRSQALGVLYG